MNFDVWWFELTKIALAAKLFWLLGERVLRLFALLSLASQDMDNDGRNGSEPEQPKSQQWLIEMLISDAHKQFVDVNKVIAKKDT